MTARLDFHASDSDLQDFTRGKLDDSAARALIDHLEECADCRERAARLPDGTLLPPGGNDPAPAPAPVRTPAPVPHPPGDVPPELARQTGYEILKELGRGGMGVVYLARNLLMDRLEVLKVMSRALVGRQDAVERFAQEIRSVARLNHPNVATAYTTLLLGDLLVLAMEYVEGDDLSKVVKARGRLPVPLACFCVREAALGLQRGHELGLVHRDVKPGNLILSQQGNRAEVKIVDFGLAKARAESPVDHELTPTNQMMGTLGYTAPEQLCDAKSVDTRADIYSLGCTLYFLLAGDVPFKGNSAYEVFLAQEAEEVQPLRSLRPDVPAALEAVVAKMMAKRPANRFAQPADVARELTPFAKTGATPSAVDEVPRAPAKLPGRLPGPDYRRIPRPAARAGRAEDLPFSYGLLIGVALLIGTAIPAAAFLFGGKAEEGTVVVSNVPRDAEVVIDGEAAQRSREGSVVTFSSVHPGSHRVTVTRNGRTIWLRHVVIQPYGDTVRLVVELRQTPSPGSFQWPAGGASSPRPQVLGGAGLSDTLGGDRPAKPLPPSQPPPLIPDAQLEHDRPLGPHPIPRK
jgi:serine/threonine protein kinase